MSGFETVIAKYEHPGERFEELVERAAAAGMTHVVITEGTPLATWQNDAPERSQANGEEGSSTGGSTGDAGDLTRSGENDDRPGAEGASSAGSFEYDPYPSWYNRKLGLLKIFRPPHSGHTSPQGGNSRRTR